MPRKRTIVILLAVGLLISPLLIWMLVSSHGIVSAQTAAPCTNCLWLPLLVRNNGATELNDPTPTPLIVPTPRPVIPVIPPVATIENPNIRQQSVVWTLDAAEIVSAGVTGVMAASPDFPGGVMTNGYVIQANAISNRPDVAFSGTLQVTLSIFSPAQDYGTQKAGVWYVQGAWKLTREGVNAAAIKTRHNPSVLSGQIKAELPFNPANGVGNWTGLVKLPMSQSAGRWARGAGTLSLNADLNGYLALDANVWPEMR